MPIRAASLGWIATPATTVGQRVAASTAHRELSTSQPICTIRRTPTSAARLIASSAARPVIDAAMSRWQWVSTTWPGSGSGEAGSSGRPPELTA